MKIISRILRPLPQMLYLEPAFGCNYRCFFCMHGSDPDMKPVHLTPEVFERLKPVVDQAAHIHLTGLGEPLLNPHLADYLTYFRDAGKKYYINTNGALIQDKHIELLLTSMCELSVSLDAADRQTYGQMRIGGNWDKVVRTIKRISDLRLRRSSRFPLLYLALHLNRMNLPSLQYLPDLCSDLRIDAVKLSWTILPETHEHLSPHQYLPKAAEMIRPVVAALRQRGVGIRDEVLFEPHMRGCWDLTGIGFIGANGMVAACCNRWTAVGDLGINSFEEIWNGRPHRRIFFGILNHRPIDACTGCRQLGVVDYVGNPATFVKDGGADAAVLVQKQRVAEKLPVLGNLEKEFAAGFEALTADTRDMGRALDIYASLARRYPDYYEIRNNLAVAYLLDGQPEKCRAALEDMQSLPHNRSIVQYNVAYLKSAASMV
jgi:MoaA/NifB/PqqE/SkfB family radical SAM enzyme